MAMNQGRDPMKGRTGVGGKLASPGKIRKGQSEPASNKFTTRTRAEFSRKAPLVPDNAKTSADAQAMIKEAPDPFKNRMQAPQMPVGTSPRGAKPGPVQKPYANLQNKTVGNKALPPGRPVGQTKPINQSGQMNGRFGTSFPKRKGNSAVGQPSRRNASFYGE
jgi:hypothetical protein